MRHGLSTTGGHGPSPTGRSAYRQPQYARKPSLCAASASDSNNANISESFGFFLTATAATAAARRPVAANGLQVPCLAAASLPPARVVS